MKTKESVEWGKKERRMRVGVIYNTKHSKSLESSISNLHISLDNCELVEHIYWVVGQGHTLTE